jgi:hypothetical protein
MIELKMLLAEIIRTSPVRLKQGEGLELVDKKAWECWKDLWLFEALIST